MLWTRLSVDNSQWMRRRLLKCTSSSKDSLRIGRTSSWGPSSNFIRHKLSRKKCIYRSLRLSLLSIVPRPLKIARLMMIQLNSHAINRSWKRATSIRRNERLLLRSANSRKIKTKNWHSTLPLTRSQLATGRQGNQSGKSCTSKLRITLTARSIRSTTLWSWQRTLISLRSTHRSWVTSAPVPLWSHFTKSKRTITSATTRPYQWWLKRKSKAKIKNHSQ